MTNSILPLLLVFGPLCIAVLIFLTPVHLPRLIEALHLVSVGCVLAASCLAIALTLGGHSPAAFGTWMLIDPLAAIFVGIIGVIGFLTGLYSISYIRHDVAQGALTPARHRLYYGFFSLFLFTMLLAVTANNIVIMWVSIEATTLGSTFLVGLYGRRAALEAAWKYLMICSVGVAFGLYGTLLTFANASAGLPGPQDAVLWTTIAAHAGHLDPVLAKIAYVFVLIGFGTKAGIFPMHAWLPDAHSEAPSPVSALLSGVLLNCALFVIIRYTIVTETAVGPAFPQSLLLTLGLLSVGFASFLFFVQQDLKRKLAYSSVENIGLILLGFGFGGPLGTGAALLHIVNHSAAKALMFCGSGNVLMTYGTRDLGRIKGLLRVAPLTGVLLMIGALALAGFPPFSVFVSEFMMISAGVAAGRYGLIGICVLLMAVVVAAFVQIITGSVLGKTAGAVPKGDVGWGALAPMGVLVAIVLVMGIAVPQPVTRLLTAATAIVNGPALASLSPKIREVAEAAHGEAR